MKAIKIKAQTTFKYLSFFNGLFKLTENELKVLTALVENNEEQNLCSAANKKKIAEILEIKDHNTLNNYVKRLKDKKAIIKDKANYKLNPMLIKQNRVIAIIADDKD
jgi:predicted transcriptional regulator